MEVIWEGVLAQSKESQTIASLQKQVLALEEKLAFYELAVKKYPQQIWILDDDAHPDEMRDEVMGINVCQDEIMRKSFRKSFNTGADLNYFTSRNTENFSY